MRVIRSIIAVTSIITMSYLPILAAEEMVIRAQPTLEDKVLGADVIVKGRVSSVSLQLFHNIMARETLIVEYILSVDEVLLSNTGIAKEIVVKSQMPTDHYDALHTDLLSRGFYLLRRSVLFQNPRHEVYEPWGIGGALSEGDSFLPLDAEDRILDALMNRQEAMKADGDTRLNIE